MPGLVTGPLRRSDLCTVILGALLASNVALSSSASAASPAPKAPDHPINASTANTDKIHSIAHQPALTALNPQPLPPVDKPRALNALNPQPLPPDKRPGTLAPKIGN